VDAAYRTAFLDWLACAFAGRRERAARAARGAGDGTLERVAWLGAAGHVLDFDDTYLPGIAHLSAPTAPAALALAAELDRPVGDMLAAYAAGFEAMGALALASHPALYDGGWHPTAACGGAGAAVTAGRLLELDGERAEAARRLALLGAGGRLAAFGSDGKSLQVGTAAATGVLAARAAAGGARAGEVTGGPPVAAAAPDGGPAIADNWIKPWPCCLLAHGAIEAAAQVRGAAPGGDAFGNGAPGGGAPAGGGLGDTAAVEVTVHPVARAAAAYDDVADGLQAKFSIPYLVAYTLLRGEPTPASFDAVDREARALAAARVRVRTDPALLESEARLTLDGELAARVEAARGSPGRPLTPDQLAGKVRSLAGERLDGLVDDDARPARAVLAALLEEG
jgi:2-methylcitrate dehydratase PrpD